MTSKSYSHWPVGRDVHERVRCGGLCQIVSHSQIVVIQIAASVEMFNGDLHARSSQEMVDGDLLADIVVVTSFSRCCVTAANSHYEFGMHKHRYFWL